MGYRYLAGPEGPIRIYHHDDNDRYAADDLFEYHGPRMPQSGQWVKRLILLTAFIVLSPIIWMVTSMLHGPIRHERAPLPIEIRQLEQMCDQQWERAHTASTPYLATEQVRDVYAFASYLDDHDLSRIDESLHFVEVHKERTHDFCKKAYEAKYVDNVHAQIMFQSDWNDAYRDQVASHHPMRDVTGGQLTWSIFSWCARKYIGFIPFAFLLLVLALVHHPHSDLLTVLRTQPQQLLWYSLIWPLGLMEFYDYNNEGPVYWRYAKIRATFLATKPLGYRPTEAEDKKLWALAKQSLITGTDLKRAVAHVAGVSFEVVQNQSPVLAFAVMLFGMVLIAMPTVTRLMLVVRPVVAAVVPVTTAVATVIVSFGCSGHHPTTTVDDHPLFHWPPIILPTALVWWPPPENILFPDNPTRPPPGFILAIDHVPWCVSSPY